MAKPNEKQGGGNVPAHSPLTLRHTFADTRQACSWLLVGMGSGVEVSAYIWLVLPEMMAFMGCLVYYRVRKTDRVITARFEKHTNNSCYYDVIVL